LNLPKTQCSPNFVLIRLRLGPNTEGKPTREYQTRFGTDSRATNYQKGKEEREEQGIWFGTVSPIHASCRVCWNELLSNMSITLPCSAADTHPPASAPGLLPPVSAPRHATPLIATLATGGRRNSKESSPKFASSRVDEIQTTKRRKPS